MNTSIAILDSPAETEVEVLTGVTWEAYEQFLKQNDKRWVPHSYSDGELRIMSPGVNHESLKRWFACLIDALTEEMELPRRSLGSTTLKSVLRKKGVEPDEAYLLANEAALRGRVDYDLDVDPPPDLVLEIDITSTSAKRLGVYANLRVPEIWVYDGETLSVKLLDGDSYSDSDSSASFPFLPMRDFAGWLEKAFEFDELTWIRQFRQWVRDSLKTDE